MVGLRNPRSTKEIMVSESPDLSASLFMDMPMLSRRF